MHHGRPISGGTEVAAQDHAAVLVVDDDEWTRQTTSLNLRRLGIRVYEADTGAAAIAEAQLRPIDVAILDLCLPDISALQVVAALKEKGIRIPWILYSGWLTVAVAVEAIKLGAVNAVELPFDIEAVVMPALDQVLKRRAAEWPPLPLTPRLPGPKSAAERWASVVLRGCDAGADPRTLLLWASSVAMSYSRLTETCHIVGIAPLSARDFTRILRVLFHTGGRLTDLGTVLDISDGRTLRGLLQRAGLTPADAARALSLPAFVSRQRFVNPDHSAVRALVSMLQGLRSVLLVMAQVLLANL